MESSTQSTLVDPADSELHWATVDALVRDLGSTLDVSSLAERTQRVLAAHLGLTAIVLCSIDAAAQRVIPHGPLPAALVGEVPPWTLRDSLRAKLRTDTATLTLSPEELPDGLASGSERRALRLLDGADTVGLVLVCDGEGSAILEHAGDDRLRSVGGLLGAALSRALVHQSLANVTARLDSAQRLQQHILDHVSHEFNTPLMILKSAAQFADTDDHEERTAFLDMHAQALKRLEDLVQGVLEVARARAHGRVEVLQAYELLEAVVMPALDSEEWPTNHVQRWMLLPREFRAKVDAEGISFVLSHLLRNAWRFGGVSGAAMGVAVYPARLEQLRSVSLEERLLEGRRCLHDRVPPSSVCYCEGADRLVIDVMDAGIGIPSDELEFVFQPFTQARNSPLRGISGAGMGLPTCRKRVDAMGGELWLHSREGAGTRATVLIPV